MADETTPHNWRHLGGAYVDSRIQAEELVLRYHREQGLPAVVLNVGTTFGPRDHGPTPHGKLVRAAARGKMPAYAKGASMEVVGIEDAARAFLLAEEHGRPGERYIISERCLPTKDIFDIAADEGGATPPRDRDPAPGDASHRSRRRRRSRAALGRDSVVTPTSVRLLYVQTALDHSKATRELGWEPAPIEGHIRAGVRWFLDGA